MDLLTNTFLRNAFYKGLTSPDSPSTAEWSLWGEWHTVRCVFHRHKEGLCRGSIAPGRVPLWQTILLPRLQGRSSLGLVPPTIPAPPLDWKFSQSIEAVSQLRNLGHREKEDLSIHLEVVMDAGYPKVLQPGCPFRACKSRQDSSRVEASRLARPGPRVNGAQVRRPSRPLCQPAPLQDSLLSR